MNKKQVNNICLDLEFTEDKPIITTPKNVTNGKNSINDIDLSIWKEYDDIKTDSLWIIDKSEREAGNDASYHGLFIPEIPRQMILRYTRKGEVVLDTFIGAGT